MKIKKFAVMTSLMASMALTSMPTYAINALPTPKPAEVQYNTDGSAFNGWMRMSYGKNCVYSVWCYYIGGNLVKSDWILDGSTWYYCNQNGIMLANTSAEIDGSSYYFLSSGAMAVNRWIQNGSTWHYFDKYGKEVRNGWVYSGGNWYFMDEWGIMVSDTRIYINGKSYKFDANGVCLNP